MLGKATINILLVIVFTLLVSAMAAAAPSGLALTTQDYGSGAGGDLATITGQGMEPIGLTRVVFGTEDATGVVVNDLGAGNYSVTFTTPAHAGGDCNITVINPDLSSATLASAFVFVPRTFDTGGETMLPRTGPTSGGTKVFYLGLPSGYGGLFPLLTMRLGGAVISGWREYSIPGHTALYSAVTPAHAAGLVSLTCDELGGMLPDCFIYGNATTPALLSCAPKRDFISGGATIRIFGANLGMAGTTQITFGGVAATNVLAQPDFGGWISCTLPPHAAGTVDIVVTNPDLQTCTLANGFTYDPVITPVPASLSPSTGYTIGGTSVTITGTGFTQSGTTRVTFGGVDATSVSVVNAGAGIYNIQCTTPAHAAGAVDVVVTSGGTTGALQNAYTYSTPPTPIALSVTPNQGFTLGDENVTVTGIGFSTAGTTRVTFGGVDAAFVYMEDHGGGNLDIHCNTPAHAAGAVDITVTGPGNISGPPLTNGYTYVLAPPPAPSSTSPNQGLEYGGEDVFLYGTGFMSNGVTRVSFGGVDSPMLSVVDSTKIACIPPAHAAGIVDVVVYNPDGQSGTLVGGYEYLVPPPPGPLGVSPAQGLSTGGDTVDIIGSGFTLLGTTRVTFGGTDAAGVTVFTAGQLQCVVPPHAPGVVDVTVINPDGQSGTIMGGYEYLAATPPTLSSLNPALGVSTGGLWVHLYGSGYTTAATTRVTFDGTDATGIYIYAPGHLGCYTPAHAAGTVDVTVTNIDGQNATLANGFTYVAPGTPLPSFLSPSAGTTYGGDTVTISGSNFTQTGTTRVTFGGVDATNVHVYSTGYGALYIACQSPAHTAGVVDVTVINPGGLTGTLSSSFTYHELTPPVPVSITPNQGFSQGGDSVQIDGTGFMSIGTTSVTFDGLPATSVWLEDLGTGILRLHCQTPAHATGVVDVAVIGPGNLTGTLPGAFTYVPAPAPSPTSVTLNSGPTAGGVYVSINGTDFASWGTIRVTFGGVDATNVGLVYPGYLSCVVPPHAAGLVDVVVINPDGQSGTLPNGYEYVNAPPPNPTSLTPNQGPSLGGTGVTISGTGFDQYGTVRVTFGGVDATNVQVLNTGYGNVYVVCHTPAHAPGMVDLAVINSDGQSGTLPNGFTYTASPAPHPTSITPNQGPSLGYTQVVLSGTGFSQSGTTRVTFDGIDATSVQVYNGGYGSLYVSCFTPIHAPGAVAVAVINADGQSGTLADTFTYVASPPPSPTAVSPDHGGTPGGTAVTISGPGYAISGTIRVAFGGVDATNVQVFSTGGPNLEISCTTPAHAAGAVDVTVINPDGQSGTLPGAFTYLASSLNIVQHPQGRIVNLGSSHALNVVTQGGIGTVHYQWKKDGQNLTVSADGPTYSIASMTEEDAGDYVCEVSDDYYAVTSDTAKLTAGSALPAAGLGTVAVLGVLLVLAATACLRSSPRRRGRSF